ncbi:MAG: methyltransferase domain-containing protein [Planctomycetes bacterium]|nr:methyltransferase domain-containing protein [Planctomycetota bacterium]
MTMRTRSLEPEILDVDRPPREELERAHRFMRWANRWGGGLRATRLAFREFSRGWRPDERIRVLDVASGTGDIPCWLARWDPRLEFVCLDREADPSGAVRVRGDALRLPFRDGAFDYVTTSLFLHHLTDDAARAALGEFDRVARRGLIMNDLLRCRRLYWWTKAATLFGNGIARHDGPLSVRKSFTVPELRELARAWPTLKVRLRLGHRVVVYGEKARASEPPDV